MTDKLAASFMAEFKAVLSKHAQVLEDKTIVYCTPGCIAKALLEKINERPKYRSMLRRPNHPDYQRGYTAGYQAARRAKLREPERGRSDV